MFYRRDWRSTNIAQFIEALDAYFRKSPDLTLGNRWEGSRFPAGRGLPLDQTCEAKWREAKRC